MVDFSSGQLALLSVLTGIWSASLTVIRGWGTLRKPEMHHFYVGLVVLFVANAMQTFAAPQDLVDIAAFIGLSLVADDTFQHVYQAVEFARTGVIRYSSPWHDLYVWAYRRVEMWRWPCPRCEREPRAVVAYDLGNRVVERRSRWCHTCLATP